MHIAVDDAIDAMDNLPKEPITVDVVVNRQTSKATTTQAELASWLVDEFTNSPNAESQIDELERQLAKVVREAGLSEKQRRRGLII